ncbi:MAG: type II toxin-antitoxin system RelE/ParE family toxin [Chloroflexota bacterium]|nr:type II toxin-antitoxin system RelE/ParE family toxin [Chloroflexota bacterium]
MLAGIRDRRVQRGLLDRMDKLGHDPEQQGKPLRGELSDYRSIRAVGQRYRIIYRIYETRRVVQVIGAGLRKQGDRRDVYAQLARLLRQ